jgi:serine/threonine protein kinase/WD40 repeat protein
LVDELGEFAMADHPSQERDPVEVLAEDFLERRRRGEVPSLKEYADRYPHLADEIREVFPALVMMDDIDPKSSELSRSVGGTAVSQRRPILRQLGDFRILREIGQGGMGIVYEARQESLGRQVALKVLPPAISSREVLRERFQREARAAARLHHTNIVPIFGVGEDQGVLYYAMQFIQGQGLDTVLEDVKRMRGLAPTVDPAEQTTLAPTGAEAARSLITGQFGSAGPGPEQQTALQPLGAPHPSGFDTRSDLSNLPETRYYRSIAWLGVQVAEGLAHAHAQGILHRDIKPSNLLLDAHGTVWITDFGLAKTEGGVDLTGTGEMIGTLRYMAPERFEGESDARSDVYALGVTLYEMLTLLPPFSGSDRLCLIGRISVDTPPPPSQLAPLLPRDLETIVLKAMARDRAARYATARDLADDLRRFLENRPIKARRSSAAERFRRWCRRNPVVAGLVGAVSVLLLCLTAGSLVWAFQLNQKNKAVATAEAESTEKLYEALVAQANASRFSHRVGQRLGTLEAVAKAADLVRERQMPPERLDDLRTLAIAAMTLPDFKTLRTWPAFSDDWQHWAADDRLRHYARVEENGSISLRRVDTDEQIARLEGSGPVATLQFSPGGRFLTAFGGQHLQAWDLDSAAPQLVYDGEDHEKAFHPDERHVLLYRRDGSLAIHDWQAPREKPFLLSTRLPRDTFLSFDPTGSRLAAIPEGKVQILEVSTGKLLVVLPEARSVGFVAWHPSGNYLALVVTGGEIHVWDLKRTTLMANLQGCRTDGMHVEFTPDGDRLLSNGFEGILRLWDWRTGRQILQQPGASYSGSFHVSSDGHLLIQNGRQLSLVEVISGREYRSLVRQSNVGTDIGYWGTLVHPEGRLLAAAMSDGARLFDLETGDELALLPTSGFSLLFTPDGALLTNGPEGLLRWPIRLKANPNRLQVGPPEALHFGTFLGIACDKKVEIIGQPAGDGAYLVRPGNQIMHLGPHTDARSIALSPDGKYAATGNFEGVEGVKIWSTHTGELLARVPAGSACGGCFSPDGKWLYVGGTRGCFILKVGTWEQSAADRWQGFARFSHDGSLVLTKPGPSILRFQGLDSGREIVRLEDPDEQFGDVTLTPDGSKLIWCSQVMHSIHVWDLRLIRKQLADMGLDWDAPPYPKAEPPGSLPLQVTVDAGPGSLDPSTVVALASLRLGRNPLDFEAYLERGKAFGRLNARLNAIVDYSMALALMPPKHKSRGEALFRRSNNYRPLNDPVKANADLQQIAEQDLSLPPELVFVGVRQFNKLAWQYVTGPEKERAPHKALPLIRKAIQLMPHDGTLFNTQGVVYYRLGQYTQALESLEHSLRMSKGEAAAFDLFFLAMCHAKLGASEKARDCYDQAIRWVKEHPSLPQPHWAEELKRFQTEAEAVLAAKEPRP